MVAMNKSFISYFVFYLIIAVEHNYGFLNKATAPAHYDGINRGTHPNPHSTPKQPPVPKGPKPDAPLTPKPKDPYNHKELLESNRIKNIVKKINAPAEHYVFKGTPHRLERRDLIYGTGHTHFNNLLRDVYATLNNKIGGHRREKIKPWNNLNFPFEEVIQRLDVDRIGSKLALPVYIKAKILSKHVTYAKRHPKPSIPSHIYSYLDLVGRIVSDDSNDPNADDAGHLLAHSLGGTSDDQFNFSPQTARLNRHAEVNSYSMWLGEEIAMNKFLSAVPNRRIEWQLLVTYPPKTATGKYRLRPISFCLQHQNYNEYDQDVDNYNNTLTLALPVMCFSNNANDECGYYQL